MIRDAMMLDYIAPGGQSPSEKGGGAKPAMPGISEEQGSSVEEDAHRLGPRVVGGARERIDWRGGPTRQWLMRAGHALSGRHHGVHTSVRPWRVWRPQGGGPSRGIWAEVGRNVGLGAEQFSFFVFFYNFSFVFLSKFPNLIF
jgi:hypothetical protein